MMITKVRRFNEVTDQMMDIVNQQVGALDMINDMDETQFKLVKTMIDLVDASKDMMTEQATIIDDQNRKLDILLRKLDEIKLSK